MVYGIIKLYNSMRKTVIFMIKKILNQSSCAACRMCCVFDRYDIWETPLFDEATMNKVKVAVPDAEFAPKGSGYVLNVAKITGDELFSCPALSENGCILRDEKPFDCRIWPFRVMKLDGRRVIAVSSLCDEVHGQSHSFLLKFLKEGLAAEIFAYADKFPEALHEYYDNYSVLLYENEI